MDLKAWNASLKKLRQIITSPKHIDESKKIILRLHSMVHLASVSDYAGKTFEDDLWENFDEELFRNKTDKKGRTIVYNLWHSARIEDITSNLLIANKSQIFERENWYNQLNATIKHTGNSLAKEGILKLSENINIQALKEYRIAVGQNTQNLVKALDIEKIKAKIYMDNLPLIIQQNAVDNVESANWLIDYWAKRNVAGIILMPVTRHNLVHINEAKRIIGTFTKQSRF